MENLSKYDQQALNFLNETNTTIIMKYTGYMRHFSSDDMSRDVWRVKIKNKLHSYSFDFGQSIANQGERPTEYSILACLQKYDVGGFEEFCSEFGYEQYNEYTGKENRQSKKIYNSVCKEFENVEKLFDGDQLDQLQQIQ